MVRADLDDEAGLRATFLETSFFYEMFIYAGLSPHRGPDGTATLTLPMGDSVMALVAAEELGNMFQFFTQAADTFVGNRDLDLIRTLNPRLQPLEDWLLTHRPRLQAAL